MSFHKLVLLRHGESLWNRENRFTGWVDVDLSPKGLEEAQRAGDLLKAEAFDFDLAFTSVLKRAIRTLWTVQDRLDRMWIPVHRSWRLNERHYGALQGLNKAETTAKYGEDQVHIWRRSFDVPPPPMLVDDPQHPRQDPKYRKVEAQQLPSTEALKQCKDRVLPYWDKYIVPAIQDQQKVLIVAHGNSLRALIKHLDGISDEKISELNIPTGIPLVYELDRELRPLKHYYLGDPAEAEKAAQAVAKQGQLK